MLAKKEHLFLEDIENASRGIAGACVERLPHGIAVCASGPDGFNMSVTVERGRFSLHFGDWADTFDSEEITRELFQAALRGEARIKIDVLSGQQWRWTLERRGPSGTWSSEGAIGHVIWRFWGRRSTIVLRNDFERSQAPGQGNNAWSQIH